MFSLNDSTRVVLSAVVTGSLGAVLSALFSSVSIYSSSAFWGLAGASVTGMVLYRGEIKAFGKKIFQLVTRKANNINPADVRLFWKSFLYWLFVFPQWLALAVWAGNGFALTFPIKTSEATPISFLPAIAFLLFATSFLAFIEAAENDPSAEESEVIISRRLAKYASILLPFYVLYGVLQALATFVSTTWSGLVLLASWATADPFYMMIVAMPVCMIGGGIVAVVLGGPVFDILGFSMFIGMVVGWLVYQLLRFLGYESTTYEA